MKNLGQIDETKDIVTKEYVDNSGISSITSSYGVSSSASTLPERWTLPNDYQEVEYIASDSNKQLIDTGIDGIDVRKIECTFATLSSLSSQYITGSRALTSQSANSTIIFALNGSSSNTYYSGNYNGTSLVATTVDRADGVKTFCSQEIGEVVNGQRLITYYVNNGTNEETVTATSNNCTISGFNVYMFGWNINSALTCRIYEEKIYTDAGLVRHFIPCYKKSNNEIGMYDLVTNQFYTDTTTSFTRRGENVTYIPQMTNDLPYMWERDIIRYTDGTVQINNPYIIERRSEDEGNNAPDIFLDATIEQDFPIISDTSNVQSIEMAITNFSSNNQMPSHIVIDTGEGIMSGIVEQIVDGGSQKTIQFMIALTESGNTFGIMTGALTYNNNTWQLEQLGTYILSNFLTESQADLLYELQGNKVTTISSSSTDSKYPSAKAVYDYAAQKSLYGDTTINVGRKSSTTVGTNSVAEGAYNTASGNYSHAEGEYTIASGGYSHSEGLYANATASSSHAEGSNTFSTGSYSHSEGNYTAATGVAAHVEGGHNTTISIKATGEANATTYTVADTTNVKVGDYVKFGSVLSKVTGVVSNTSITVTPTLSSSALNNSTVYVMINVASGNFSHAEGNKTTSGGTASHAEGYETSASGYYSHAEGCGTIAQRKSQHAIGEYNAYDMTGGQATHGKYIAIAGNGTNNSNRSNAYTLDWNGNGCFAGNVYVGNTDKDNANAKKLATEEFVSDNYIAEPSTEGTSGQVLTTDGNGGRTWTTVQGGGGGGTLDYTQLNNKPQINSITLTGNKSLSDLGIAAANSVINATDLTVSNNSVNLVDYVNSPGIYKVPSACWIYTDSASSTANRIYAITGDIVHIEPQIDVGDGEELVEFNSYFTILCSVLYCGCMVTSDNVTWTSDIKRYEHQGNKTTSISSTSRDNQYPSAKAVYDFVSDNTLRKDNTTAFTPTSDYHPATKKYVDDAITNAITSAIGGSY